MKPSAVLRLALYRTLAVALAALAVLSAVMPAPAFAADSDQQVKTVRQQQRLPGRHTGRATLGMGLRVPPDPLVLHKGLAIRIR